MDTYVISRLPSLIVGSVFLIYGLIFRSKNPEYKHLGFLYYFIGGLMMLYWLPYAFPRYEYFFFFLMIVFLLIIIYMVRFTDKIKKEQADYSMKQLEKHKNAKTIGFLDLVSGAYLYKAMLLHGPTYASRFETLLYVVILPPLFILPQLLAGHSLLHSIWSLIFILVLVSVFVYHFRKKQLTEYYNKFNSPVNEEYWYGQE